MYDVTALGEFLIDFTPAGRSENGSPIFERNPGGAPCNVLAMLAKLGKKTGFIGKVGDDQFGRFLGDTLKNSGVDTAGLRYTCEANTTLAFVHLDDSGDRTFSFYRNPGADMLLDQSDIDMDMVRNTLIFHFGTISMTGEPSRGATISAVSEAKKAGAVISFDPNLRTPLWGNLDDARDMMLEGLKFADVLKVSGEELEFITGTNKFEEGTGYIYEKFKTPIILVTLGEKGCFFRKEDHTGIVPTIDVKAIDTTGAGDAFLGAFLYKLLQNPKSIAEYTSDEVKEMVRFANTAGALTTTKKGAIPALPAIEAIESHM